MSLEPKQQNNVSSFRLLVSSLTPLALLVVLPYCSMYAYIHLLVGKKRLEGEKKEPRGLKCVSSLIFSSLSYVLVVVTICVHVVVVLAVVVVME